MSNILVIQTDDQRFDELSYMPNTQRLIRSHGTEFTQCRANVALCSPARTAILTGQNSKHHLVTRQTHNPSSTMYSNSVFVALNNAGFRVGAIGKFLSAIAGGSVKPGFDFWRCLNGSGSGYGIYDAYEYTVDDGTSTLTPGIFQDHYFAGQAIDFVRGSQPWCLWFCLADPHWPWQAPPNHQLEWAYRDFPFDIETDVSDKPAWIQALPALDAAVLAELQNDQRVRLRELLACDDAIGALVAAVDSTGLADDTTIMFTSDNGNMLGEHRIVGPLGARAGQKNTVYDPTMRVPLLARGPGFAHQTVTAPTTHADITATMLDVANIASLLPNQAGISLLNIAGNPGGYTARQLLHFRDAFAAGVDDGWPTADGITTATRKLWRHQGQTGTQQFELYDLVNDPGELVNRANDGGTWLTERTALNNALNTLLA